MSLRDRIPRIVTHAALLLGAAAILAACNYPGGLDSGRPAPIESPTSPPVATLPTPLPSGCIEELIVLGEAGYPDAAPAGAGTSVERTWRVRNSGTCEWTTEYALVPVEGDSFGLATIPLAAQVAPGGETDLRLVLTAPVAPGLYSGGWALRSPNGAQLGAGSRPLRVRINVGPTPAEPTAEVYNLADQMCSARWVAASPSRSGRLLPCPGYDRDEGGSVVRIGAPRFSNGALDDEPALLVHPPFEDGGLISGTFPPYSVQTGDQFRGILGCGAEAPGCSARFQLNVREGGQLLPVAEWLINEHDAPRSLVVDLSFLAGKTVELILGVDADGPGAADAAIWLQPRIVR